MEPVQKRMKLGSNSPNILDLPNEVLETIFLKLSQYEVQQNVALVCSRFLDITRRPVFVQNVLIYPMQIEKPHWRLPTFDFPNCCVKKMEKIKKFYPNCNFELTCPMYAPQNIHYDQDEPKEYRETVLIGFSWMKTLLPHASSITKLTLAVDSELDDYSDFISLQNLESLDLDISMAHSSGDCIHNLKAEFWSNFPILKSLRIKTKWDTDEKCVSKFLGLNLNFRIIIFKL